MRLALGETVILWESARLLCKHSNAAGRKPHGRMQVVCTANVSVE